MPSELRVLSMPQNRLKTDFRGPFPDIGKRTQFIRGVSGNPGGRPKKKPVSRIFEQIFEDPKSLEEIKAAVMKVIRRHDMATVLMLKLMADRLEGKAIQSIHVSGARELSDLSDEELQLRLESLSSVTVAKRRTA